ncbi:MAG: cohesin domain-containing protein, partial [Candidatus Bathyarchaeia archaeon]
MLKKTARLLIATLILLELSIIAIAALPPRMTTVKAALETDMPVVFVDPVNATANVGESFTISVKVFNLSGDFYPTEEAWSEGEPLPPLQPDNWRYNLSLGHLYAIDLRIKWDPTILEYVSHTVVVPVEDHAGGILHEPIIEAADTVDPVAGTYWLSRSCQAPAPAFNAPDANATAFTMTFSVKKQGKCDINFTNVDLVVDTIGLGFPFSVPSEIPHWTKNGQFQTEELSTRIEIVEAGALIEGELCDPAIHGEFVA